MKYNPDRHYRRSIRLKGYDYSQPGYYFITICTKNREMLFGKVVNGKMVLNYYGKIVRYTWFDLTNHNDKIELDVFTIMPNHVHGIIVIKNDTADIDNSNINGSGMIRVGSEPTLIPQKHHPLPEIVRQLKTFSARRINKKRNITGVSVWHRNYYGHIICNDNELDRIRYFIKNNPVNLKDDGYHV